MIAVLATSCGHLFHEKCLRKWFEQSKSCPFCRTDQNFKIQIKIFFPQKLNSIVSKGDFDKALNSVNDYKKKIEENKRLLELEKKQSSELQKQIEDLQNQVRWADIIKREDIRLAQEKRAIQSKLNKDLNQEKILTGKQKMEIEILNKSIRLEKQQSSELQKQIEDLQNQVRWAESIRKENIRLAQEKRAIQSKLNFLNNRTRQNFVNRRIIKVFYKNKLSSDKNKFQLLIKKNYNNNNYLKKNNFNGINRKNFFKTKRKLNSDLQQ